MNIILEEHAAIKKFSALFFNAKKLSGDCFDFAEKVYDTVTKTVAGKNFFAVKYSADDIICIKNKPLSRFSEPKITLARSAVKGEAVFYLSVSVNSSAVLELDEPVQIFFAGYTKKTAGIPKLTVTPALRTAIDNANKSIAQSAEKETEFITKFNTEIYHTRLMLDGKPVSKPQALGIYSANKTCADLSDINKRLAFISLYAITFHGISIEQIFTVDQIFTLQPARTADNLKRQAANEVLALIYENNPDKINAVIAKMKEKLKSLHRPSFSNTPDVKTLFTLVNGYDSLTRETAVL